MSRLFKDTSDIAESISRVTNLHTQGFADELDDLLAAGTKVYLQAVNEGLNNTFADYLTNVRTRMLRSKNNFSYWRNLTQDYRQDKNPIIDGNFSYGTTSRVGERDKQNDYPNNYFKGFRYFKGRTYKSRKLSGESLMGFMNRIEDDPKSASEIRKIFGGIEKQVYGSIFKSGTNLRSSSKRGGELQTPVLEDGRGRRVTIKEALKSRGRTYTATGVIRTSDNRVRYQGKVMGLAEASRRGLIGSKVSYSIAQNLINSIKSKGVIAMHGTYKNYRGIFSGSENNLQATKLHDLETGSSRTSIHSSNGAIAPFTEEAMAMLGIGGKGTGYLHQNINVAVYRAGERSKNETITSVYGKGRVIIR